jgi:hypothetical protein
MFTPFAFVKSPVSAAPPFSPTDIAGLQCWWDAQTGLTLSGTDVVEWVDQSGNNFYATQSTVADRPSISSSIAAINSKDAVRFDSSNTEFMSIVDSGGTAKPWLNASLDNSYTMFIVTNQVTQTAFHYGVYITQGDTGKQSVGWGPQTYPDGFISFGVDNYAAGGIKVSGSTTNDPFTTGTWYTSMVSYTNWEDAYFNAAASSSYRVNGTTYDSVAWGAAPNTPTTANPRLGRFIDAGTDAHLNALVAELIVYTGSLSVSEIEQVEDYLQTKYGHY